MSRGSVSGEEHLGRAIERLRRAIEHHSRRIEHPGHAIEHLSRAIEHPIREIKHHSCAAYGNNNVAKNAASMAIESPCVGELVETSTRDWVLNLRPIRP